ncbi:Arginase/deacetylase [Aspergillus steynii IBT 23096]|uniref:Arginase/deacetylase n=1 Tax=Aspergillus steynii IBT 23096 TaxID=1392250 RepID=A0A2I2GCF8_9EURO|nr:Arginase/deacetylase [Aspergillus steynii IBT 23096]PLB50569.1 Arginase/deacetylase [Aspergillus steynii IBT 23096]
MHPSNRDDPLSFTPSFAQTSIASSPSPPPPPTIDPTPWSDHLNNSSTGATPLPASPSALSSSRLSPSNAPPRSDPSQAHSTPRRTTSSNSLRDECRGSAPSLKKRSSTASLRSIHRGSGGSPRPTLSRQSSTSTFATSPTSAHALNMPPKRPSLHAPQEQPVPTAALIAADHFQKELDLHQSADLQSRTVVVLHDACYGHRFSRPRSTRTTLNSIVERPERIQAGVLGVSAAYVRLAHRYAGGRFLPHLDLNPSHLPVPPFQIRRTERTMTLGSPAVTHVHGTKWMDDLKSMCDAAESRLALNGKELTRPRSAGKDGAAANAPALHEGDLYLCSESLNAFEGALGGVCEGVDAVLGPGSTTRAFVCIRPPGHHCSSGHPSGFCWINNVHVGISYAAMTHGLTHAAILDFDLHHGDGSQEIAWDQNQKAMTAPKNAASYKKAMTGYFSLHDINSYPCEGGEPDKVRNASVCIDNAHGQSIWNVHLEPWKTERDFWEHYAAKYTMLIEKARAFLRRHTERLLDTPQGPPPKAAIFISAGFDASEWESAGMQRHKVNVPTDFYARFTADVVRMASEEGLGVDGRVISVLEGGYSNRALTSGVLSHLSGLSDSRMTADGVDDSQMNRLAAEMSDRLGIFDAESQPTPAAPAPPAAYDSDWWSPAALEELEALVYPPSAPVKSREKAAPTYFAPTQSFTAKVVSTPRDRRSNGSQISLDHEAPPIPPVGWATATHELSKILIPSHRQTASCRPEELNAEASRVRRERVASTHGAGGATAPSAPEGNRRKLRERKPKTSLPSTPKTESPKRPAPKDNRRTTIDPASDLPDASKDEASPAMRAVRRKSATSTSASTRQPPERHTVGDPDPRSSSGANSRPGTAAGGRKTSGSRPTTPRHSASPRKASPVPPVPSVLPTEGTGATPQDEVDSLAAGVRKLNIKLKVPSPEEHAARERKAAEERKKRSTKPAKTPRSPRRGPLGVKGSQASTSKPASRSSSAPISSQVDARALAPQTAPSSVAHPTESGKLSASGGSETTNLADPHGWTDLVEVSNPTPLPTTTANMSQVDGPHSTLFSPPTSAGVNKNGLPVFMSSGPIPFASSSAARQSENETFER